MEIKLGITNMNQWNAFEYSEFIGVIGDIAYYKGIKHGKFRNMLYQEARVDLKTGLVTFYHNNIIMNTLRV